MTESAVAQASPETAFKKYIPYLTAFCALASIVLFVGINLEPELNHDAYRKWGSPSTIDLFNGSLWGLITSSFLHVKVWHIVFNVYWWFLLGKKIEFESSHLFYVSLIFTSALVSSLAQLSFSDSSGIGLSGILYAFFGYILVSSKFTDAYKNYLERRVINLLIIWLFACVLLTKWDVLHIGNGAHFGGFFWGMLLAYTGQYGRKVQIASGIAVLAVLASSIYWNPFSTALLTYRAHNLHMNRQVDEAIAVYKEILAKDEDNTFAKTNLKALEVHQLRKKVVDLHQNSRNEESIEICRQILSIDSSDEWSQKYLIGLLARKALALDSAQAFDEAIEVYRQILSVDSANAWAQYNLKRVMGR